LPKGVLPKVPIKIVDPPPSLKEKWEAALMECGNKLTRILIDFHKDQILHFEELAQDTIMKGSQIIIPEFVTNIPDITNMIEQAIENLLCETSMTGKRIKSHQKRNLTTPNKIPSPNRPKNDTQKNESGPSSEEGQVMVKKKYPWRPLKLKQKK